MLTSYIFMFLQRFMCIFASQACSLKICPVSINFII